MWIGVEKDLEYAKLAINRLENENKKENLFTTTFERNKIWIEAETPELYQRALNNDIIKVST
jgi:DNA modification methylase